MAANSAPEVDLSGRKPHWLVGGGHVSCRLVMCNPLQKFADYREERNRSIAQWISTAVGTLWYRDGCFPDRRNFSSFNGCVEDLGKYRSNTTTGTTPSEDNGIHSTPPVHHLANTDNGSSGSDVYN